MLGGFTDRLMKNAQSYILYHNKKLTCTAHVPTTIGTFKARSPFEGTLEFVRIFAKIFFVILIFFEPRIFDVDTAMS